MLISIIIMSTIIYLIFFRKNKKIELKDNDLILITGGNGELAFELIKRFCDNNDGKKFSIISLDLSKNNNDLLKTMCSDKNISFYHYNCDISNLDTLEKTLEEIKNKFGTPKILINNAGIVRYGYLHETKFDSIMKEINVNSISHIFITKFFLNPMMENKEQNYTIVNICSLSGIFPVINLLGYSSSKYLMNGFNLNLRMDLKKLKADNIKTSIIYPYFFDSKLFQKCKTNNNFFDTYLFPKISVFEVGRVSYDSIINQKEETLVPFRYNLVLIISSFLPSWLNDKILIFLLNDSMSHKD